MQYIEMQTPNNQPRKGQPLAPVRRDSETHLMHCSTERGYPVARRPFGAEDEDLSNVETPLMKNPHETIVSDPAVKFSVLFVLELAKDAAQVLASKPEKCHRTLPISIVNLVFS